MGSEPGSGSSGAKQADGTGAASPGQRYLAGLRTWLEPERELADIVERWDVGRGNREAVCSPWELVACVAALQATICSRFPAPPMETNAEGLFLQLIHKMPKRLTLDQIDQWWRQQDQRADAIAENEIERAHVDILDDVVRAARLGWEDTMAEIEEDINAWVHGDQDDDGDDVQQDDDESDTQAEVQQDADLEPFPGCEFDLMFDEFVKPQAAVWHQDDVEFDSQAKADAEVARARTDVQKLAELDRKAAAESRIQSERQQQQIKYAAQPQPQQQAADEERHEQRAEPTGGEGQPTADRGQPASAPKAESQDRTRAADRARPDIEMLIGLCALRLGRLRIAYKEADFRQACALLGHQRLCFLIQVLEDVMQRQGKNAALDIGRDAESAMARGWMREIVALSQRVPSNIAEPDEFVGELARRIADAVPAGTPGWTTQQKRAPEPAPAAARRRPEPSPKKMRPSSRKVTSGPLLAKEQNQLKSELRVLFRWLRKGGGIVTEADFEGFIKRLCEEFRPRDPLDPNNVSPQDWGAHLKLTYWRRRRIEDQETDRRKDWHLRFPHRYRKPRLFRFHKIGVDPSEMSIETVAQLYEDSRNARRNEKRRAERLKAKMEADLQTNKPTIEQPGDSHADVMAAQKANTRARDDAILDALGDGERRIAELQTPLRRYPAWRGFNDETKFYRTIVDRLDALEAAKRVITVRRDPGPRGSKLRVVRKSDTKNDRATGRPRE